MLRNVTIKDMKIHATVDGQFLASGNVFARAVLPKGVDVDLDVHRIFPDLLVFDGEVPDDVDAFEGPVSDLPPPHPLPDPLPEKAFARLRPEDWVVAESVAAEREEDSGSIYIVNATVVDMPLEKLPGRHQVFRAFVAKVRIASSDYIVKLNLYR